MVENYIEMRHRYAHTISFGIIVVLTLNWQCSGIYVFVWVPPLPESKQTLSKDLFECKFILELKTQRKERRTKEQIQFLFNVNKFTLPHLKVVTQQKHTGEELKYDSVGRQLHDLQNSFMILLFFEVSLKDSKLKNKA